METEVERRSAPVGHVLRALGLVAALVVAVLGVGPVGAAPAAPSASSASSADAAAAGPVGRIGHQGRWLTDEHGRVVLTHGVNLVAKFPAEDPPTPAEIGFGADDAAFLRDQGFEVVRLGVVFGGVMPEPGVIDQAYVDSIVETVRVLGAAGLHVLVDWHQDGYGPAVHGNGFPAWATLTDGLPNPPVGFPLYYLQNPALQRAFDNFWADAPGPDGVPLQTHYATAVAAVASKLAGEAHVLGYDTMNEPWPGTDWLPCLTGCPDVEAARLAPFAARMATAIRSVDPDALVFSEPFVLFNFGRSDTSLSGFGAPGSALSFHVYAASPEEDEATIDRAVAASARGDAIMATEFGATGDVATLDRLTGALDTRLVPWIFWSYDEHLVVDLDAPPEGDNVRWSAVAALARPHPTATAGTPTALGYDPGSRTLRYTYSTTLPGGEPSPAGLVTVLAMTPTAYPDGYTVSVTGAAVASEPGSAQLVLCTDAGSAEVTVTVTPGADPDPPAPVTCDDGVGPTPTTSPPTTGGPAPAGAPAPQPTSTSAPATAVVATVRFTG